MYHSWKKTKIPLKFIVLLGILALIGSIYIELSRERVKTDYYAVQIEAAEIMAASLDHIYHARIERGVAFDRELDPNRTGIIGVEFTPLTTTLGNLEAKRTSASPDFAALLVKYFFELGLEQGDSLAVGGSSSFPGIILAVLSAASAMELESLLILSLGSSMYGANLPDFTFLDMLKVLNTQGIIPDEPIAISLGGQNDTAAGLESKEVLLNIAEKSDYPLIYKENLEDNIATRLSYYQAEASGRIKCFINIGGSSANVGKTSAYLNLTTGLHKELPAEVFSEERGVIFEFASGGTPIIHILNIRDLARNNGILVDPVPFPPAGTGDIYYQVEYSTTLVISLLLCLVLISGIIIIKYR